MGKLFSAVTHNRKRLKKRNGETCKNHFIWKPSPSNLKVKGVGHREPNSVLIIAGHYREAPPYTETSSTGILKNRFLLFFESVSYWPYWSVTNPSMKSARDATLSHCLIEFSTFFKNLSLSLFAGFVLLMLGGFEDKVK